MQDYNYEINIRLKNTKPVQLKDLSILFAGIENEFNANLGKKFDLKMPNCQTNLAISAVKPGSQIFTIVALVASDCMTPYLNYEVLVGFYDYLVTLLNDFSPKDQNEKPSLLPQYTKKNCQDVQNISQIFQNDFGMELEINITQNNQEIKKVTFPSKQGFAIYSNATEQIAMYNEIKNNTFTDKLLYFYQTQNSSQSKGDKVIIKEFSDKAKKIEFASATLKQSVIGTKDNFYKHLYRASGYVNYQNDKIKSYTVTDIEVVNQEDKNESHY